jgi:hypothetical protein
METESRIPSRSAAAGGDWLARLQELSFLASESGALAAASEAVLLTARTEEGLFYVACIGQFKRGKSTLVNALLGSALLPAGVVPVTSVVTVVRHGAERGARIRFASGEVRAIASSELAEYVSEERNPGNEKSVLAAEVFVPHALLASGLCLVDTPGLGSVFDANSAVTRSFLPHVDAGLVVLGADPPISGEELAVVEELSRHVPHLLFALNKADRLSEEDRLEARRFAERVLASRLGQPAGPILEVAAAESLAAGRATRDLPALHDALAALARESGAEIVARAQVRGLQRLAGRVLSVLAERREALVRPLEESEQRLESLRRSVEEAERSVGDLSYLFTAEQNRLSEAFTAKKDEFLERTLTEATRELEASAEAKEGDAAGLGALARRIAQGTVEKWLPQVEPVAERLYRDAMRRFVEIANQFFERLAASDASFAGLLERSLEPETGLRAPRRFFFNEIFELAPAAARFVPLALRSARAITVRGARYLKVLFEHNATRVVNDLDERVLESRRVLEYEIRERLREGLQSAALALERARSSRAAGRDAVEKELARLDSLAARVRHLLPPGPESG